MVAAKMGGGACFRPGRWMMPVDAMELCSVTLTNFKIHTDSHFEFLPGTNAICGENGAGKTSILEAIAWVLFDHCDYTRSELIRTGTKSTQVTVRFISSLDERVYEVRRCTNRGYELYDPQLNINLGLRKLEDVQAWLRTHLGVPPLTDLARLFAETIGIPQGTFTADFLKRAVERKKIFDPILKVEDYRQTYEHLKELETYAKAQVNTLTQQLALYEQQLADWADLQQQQGALAAAIAQDEAQIAQLTQDSQTLAQQLEQWAAAQAQVQSLTQHTQQLIYEINCKQEALQRLEQDWSSAQKAVEICQVRRESYQIYQTAQAALHQLSEQQRQQQDLLQQREELRQQIQDHDVQVSQCHGQLATFAQLQQDRPQWQALVPHQEQLEQQIQEVRQRLQSLTAVQQQRQALAAHYSQRHQVLGQLQGELERLLQMAQQTRPLPQLEQERQQVYTQLSQLQAGQAFAQALQTLVGKAQQAHQRQQQQVMVAKQHLHTALAHFPDLGAVQQALESGLRLNAKLLQSLDSFLQPFLDPTAAETLAIQYQHLTQSLEVAQQQQQQLALLPLKQQQVDDIQQELATLTQQQGDCDRQLAQAADLHTQLAALEADLQQLNDPRGNLRILDQQLQQATKLQQQLEALQQNRVPLQAQVEQLEARLASFADLAAQIEAQQTLQQVHAADYQLYLRHREEANKWRALDTQRTTDQAALADLQSQLQVLQNQLEQAQQSYNAEQHQQISAQLNLLQQQISQLQGSLQPKRSHYKDLEQRLHSKQQVASQRDQDQKLLTQRQAILQFIVDARHIYNQSGPRITKYYLAEVSREADQLFRELLKRDEVTLQWTEDYEIRVRERGYWRSFKSLSGGEQMCAALAIRLALLRVLANLNVAFFDEPTTNMDQLRRSQLADAISNLKAFRQLIVISHDDTFEAVTEHIIRVERQLKLN